MIDFFVSHHRHFIDHLAPIQRALPVESRFIIPGSLAEWADLRGVTPTIYRSRPELARLMRDSGNLMVVNSYSDLSYPYRARRAAVLVDHGNGQSFSNNSPHHPGGVGPYRSAAVLNIVPNDHAAERCRAAYPDTPVIAAGCAKLDEWHRKPPKPRSDPPVVCLSWHWDCVAESPEKRNAWRHYVTVLPDLVDAAERGEFVLIGHGHPRDWPVFEAEYRRLGIEPVKDLEEVFARADLYVNDSSSTLYEFASLDRPVVVLNAPWFRRSVQHGIRFWDAADVGVQVDEPHELLDGIRQALNDTPAQQNRRRRAVTHAYRYTDGNAAQRAADAIVDVLSSSEWQRQGGRVMWFRHVNSGARQFAAEGSRVYQRFDRNPNWERVDGEKVDVTTYGDPDPKYIEIPPAPEATASDQPEPKHVGGGYYEVPGVEGTVRGRTAAYRAAGINLTEDLKPDQKI